VTVLAILFVASLFAQDADRFRALAQHQADSAALRESAAQWERNEHDPARHLLAIEDIARTFLDSDPALSLNYCRKVRSAPQLWPIMFDAEARLKHWPMAGRYGEAVIEEIDAGRLFARWADANEAARMRRLYAMALEHLGKNEAAARQIEIARTERDSRIPQLRSEVLAAEINQPSTPFRLRDLNGREVALADYRGKPLVAIFWATWCAPCVEELRQLNGFFEKYPDRFVAVSTDTERDAAARFASKEGFLFPILSADRLTESAYTFTPLTLQGANVPQLYVFDARGDIRFHLSGFDDDGMLARKVEWMVAAALK
jgi:peroxiredoxin